MTTAERLEQALAECEVEFDRTASGSYVVELPGEHRLRTVVSLTPRAHALTITAFVARRPDEHHETVYRWLLQRNRKMYGMAFALDAQGDIFLTGKAPLSSITGDELDRLLGCALAYADGAFNTILSLGFATAIRREWAWRVSRGESIANLEAFRHLTEGEDEPA